MELRYIVGYSTAHMHYTEVRESKMARALKNANKITYKKRKQIVAA